MEENSHPMDVGNQPLDQIMTEAQISNADLVKASTEQLTHKQVQKARTGRRVTANIQQKIQRALEACTQQQYPVDRLFNYRGH